MSDFSHQLRPFLTPCREADGLSNLLGPRAQEVSSQKPPLAIFGAGSAGRHLEKLLRHHGIAIACFGDNHPERALDANRPTPILSVQTLRKKHPESLVIIAVAPPHGADIQNQLLQEGFSISQIFMPSLEHLLFYTVVSHFYWTNDDLKKHATELHKTIQLFEDERSQQLFLRRTALLSHGSDYCAFRRFIRDFAQLKSPIETGLFTSPRYDENHFYFNQPFCPIQDQEVFANVGALTGDCAIEFAEACKTRRIHPKKIINFEPDPGNFALLNEKLKNIPTVTSYPYGLWSASKRLRFANTGAGCPGAIDGSGDQEIEVRSLDELLPGAEITFLKMDIEGAEKEALLGAQAIIRSQKPKLAVSLYHKRNDIFEIPLLLKQLNPGYRFYLSHHSSTFDETVLFAVP